MSTPAKRYCTVVAKGSQVLIVHLDGIQVPFNSGEGADVLLPDEANGLDRPCLSLLISPDVLVIEQTDPDPS